MSTSKIEKIDSWEKIIIYIYIYIYIFVTVKAWLSLFCGIGMSFCPLCCTDLVYSFLPRLSSAPTHLRLVRWWPSGLNIRWKLRLCWWLSPVLRVSCHSYYHALHWAWFALVQKLLLFGLPWWMQPASFVRVLWTTTLLNEHDSHLSWSSFHSASRDGCSQRALCVSCGQAYRWKAVLTVHLICVWCVVRVDLWFVYFISWVNSSLYLLPSVSMWLARCLTVNKWLNRCSASPVLLCY